MSLGPKRTRALKPALQGWASLHRRRHPLHGGWLGHRPSRADLGGVLMLPDTPDMEGVLFGPDGVAEGLKPSKTVIDICSISPIVTRDLAAGTEALGCDYLDAP